MHGALCDQPLPGNDPDLSYTECRVATRLTPCACPMFCDEAGLLLGNGNYFFVFLPGLKKFREAQKKNARLLTNDPYRPFLRQSETWIEKACFRLETGKCVFHAVGKAPFESKNFRLYFELDQTVEKTEIFDPTCHSDSSFGKVLKSRRIRVSHTHATTTRHSTRPYTTASATLAWLLSLLLLLVASQRDTTLSTPVSRTCQHPDGRSARYRCPFANCCAGCSVGGSRRSPAPRWPRRRDGGERSACEAHTLLEEEARHQHVCDWAQPLEDEDLSDTTTITAKQFRLPPSASLPTLIVFLELVKLATPFIKRLEKENKNCVSDPTDD